VNSSTQVAFGELPGIRQRRGWILAWAALGADDVLRERRDRRTLDFGADFELGVEALMWATCALPDFSISAW
jgi:hypothetical protein